ncbi:MAG: hypothetical protein ACTSUE_26445 [Promethearchaeota archaeon]
MDGGNGDNWSQDLKDFGINQYGEFRSQSFSNAFSMTPQQPPSPPQHPVVSRVKRPRASTHQKTITKKGVCRQSTRLDFIQAIACANEEELTTLMHIVIDIAVRECHKDRVIGGDVEVALEKMIQKWKEFCVGCNCLKEWIHKKAEEARRKVENKEEEQAIERERKRKRTRAILCSSQESIMAGKGSNVNPVAQGKIERETKAEQREYEELLEIFGSDLLVDIGRTPEDLYQDTKNVRIGVILCMVSKSKALQRLVCVGKFYAESLGHEYQYARIPKDSLDEFLAVINVLKNAFMTQQTSPGWFVRVIQHLVIKGGVHGCVHDVLKPSRKEETIRLSMSSIV